MPFIDQTAAARRPPPERTKRPTFPHSRVAALQAPSPSPPWSWGSRSAGSSSPTSASRTWSSPPPAAPGLSARSACPAGPPMPPSPPRRRAGALPRAVGVGPRHW